MFANTKAYGTKPTSKKMVLKAKDSVQIPIDALPARVKLTLARYHIGDVIARYLSTVSPAKLSSEAVHDIKYTNCDNHEILIDIPRASL